MFGLGPLPRSPLLPLHVRQLLRDFAILYPENVGDRCTVRWRYSWGDGSIRGVDVFRVQDGKVAEKLSYVKG